jgi:hypothetical protein
MQFDMDLDRRDADPWSFVVICHGIAYPTRPPTLAAVALLQTAIESTSMKALLDFSKMMFDDGAAPSIGDWPADLVSRVIKGYLAHALKVWKVGQPAEPPTVSSN